MQHDQLEFWVDMNLPFSLVDWIKSEYGVVAKSFFELGYQTTSDIEIFRSAAQRPGVVIRTTKDYDFVNIRSEQNARPRILYLNIGNVNNKELRRIFDLYFPAAFKIITQTDQPIVEIKREP